MQNKIVLVTGATAGIGEQTMVGVARLGASVVGVGRSRARAAAAEARVRQRVPEAKITWLIGDLSSQAEVRRVAAEFKAGHRRLDVLVNNAGGWFDQRRESVDGIEMTWALNHLAYFLLTHELMDVLAASGAARVVSVSSNAHYSGKLNFDDLNATRGFSGFPAYANSKLANVVFANELARRARGQGITSNALHPGFVASQFGHNNQVWYTGLFRFLQRLFAISPERGAETSIYLASDPSVAFVTGAYFDNRQSRAPATAAQDPAIGQRLWEVSLAQCGLNGG
jgi:NAD(P)-dependent dehydrogenase (short-subunit alcohol dehydrogenase family)